MASKKNTPIWSDVKAKLADLDRAGLIRLVQDLYATSKDNQAFLHARFALGDDVLKPYKAIITQGINPIDPYRSLSVAKAKKAIRDYKKALGQPEGLAELTVFYCEEVFASPSVFSINDSRFFDALVWMFQQVLKYMQDLPAPQQPDFIARLDRVRQRGKNVGWSVGEDFNHYWSVAFGVANDSFSSR